jgi:hypothetical protein
VTQYGIQVKKEQVIQQFPRAASSDFFLYHRKFFQPIQCLPCGGYYNPNVILIKRITLNIILIVWATKYTYLGYHAVRNLWYTFTLKGAGKAKIKVDNLTNGTVWGNNLSYGVFQVMKGKSKF